MGASRYFVFFYAAMGLLPILTFSTLISILFYSAFYKIFLFFIALDLIVFSLLGSVEVLFRSNTTKIMKLEKNKIKYNYKPDSKNGIKLIISRFKSDKKQLQQTSHIVNVNRFTTVLDALLDIKHKEDPTIAIRYSCRMGICGSCGVVINGKPSLACETNLMEIAKNGVVSVEPMEGHPILKDLVTEFDDFFDKHKAIEPVLFRKDNKEKMKAKSLYDQTQSEINEFLPYSYCIMCGLCMDACPVVNTNKEFIGPQALSQAYRYYKDSRDEKGEERLTVIDKLTGLWGCEFAGACSKACPKGVDPASAIQLLKLATAQNYIDINIKNKNEDEVKK